MDGRPGLQAPQIGPEAGRRSLCTDCGISRSAEPARCGRACQFIRPDYPALETRVHGRARGAGDELFFGVTAAMWRARLAPPRAGAQWTGITTRLASGCWRPAPWMRC